MVFKKAEPSLSKLLGPSGPMERRLRLRELQTSFVYTTVLAKKCRVSPQISDPASLVTDHSATIDLHTEERIAWIPSHLTCTSVLAHLQALHLSHYFLACAGSLPAVLQPAHQRLLQRAFCVPSYLAALHSGQGQAVPPLSRPGRLLQPAHLRLGLCLLPRASRAALCAAHRQR